MYKSVLILKFLILSSLTLLSQTQNKLNTPDKNLRISLVGSSVTWSDGFLQSGFVKETISNMQRGRAITLDQSKVNISGKSEVLDGINNRKYFDGKAVKLQGKGAEINFKISGNELSIVQGMDRVNNHAANIEVYIDGKLFDTFNNLNPTPIGKEKKIFEADGKLKQFDLGRAFTYSHNIKVGGETKSGLHNKGGYGGGDIPKGMDYMIIRKYGPGKNGDPEVHHWISFKNAPAKGAKIEADYSYGEEISYERTTIGKSDKGELESPFGDGDVSFDITKPSRVSSGLDFRQTDERAVKTYRFSDIKEKSVRLVIKDAVNKTSTEPYFIFNFATNRYFHFQNAGIGGWKLAFFNKNDEFYRGYKKVIEFKPDILILETTPNDDWGVKGYKLFTAHNGISLSELQSIRTLPIKSIQYNNSTDTYNFQKWVGKIKAIDKESVSLLVDENHSIVTAPKKGDYVYVGGYFSNNKEYVVREVKSFDTKTNRIYFDKPISLNDVVYDDLQTMVGMEVRVRSFNIFENEMKEFISHIRSKLPNVNIATMVNPLPIIGARELWGYWELMNKLSAQLKIENLKVSPFYDYQYSQNRNKTVYIDAAELLFNPSNNSYETIIKGFDGKNYQNHEVLVDGKNVYGKDAVVAHGYSYSVERDLKQTKLNMDWESTGVRANQKINQPMKLMFFKNVPKTGKIQINFSTKTWSSDGCHVRTGDEGCKIYGSIYYDYINSIIK